MYIPQGVLLFGLALYFFFLFLLLLLIFLPLLPLFLLLFLLRLLFLLILLLLFLFPVMREEEVNEQRKTDPREEDGPQ